MVIIYLLIVIIYKCLLNICGEIVLIFDKLEKCFLPLMKEFHFWVLIDFRLLDVIKHSKLLTIDYITHSISNLY